MKKALLLCICLTIWGCSYHSQTMETVTPSTYTSAPHRPANSVGKLRRLALMPVELESHKEKFTSEQERANTALAYQDICARYLSARKGYEVVKVRESNEAWSARLSETGREEARTLFRQWRKRNAGKHTAMMVKRLGSLLGVDGIVVVWIRERAPMGAAGGMANIMLMNLPLFYRMASPDTGAYIYETASGRLVWSEEQSNVDAIEDMETALTGLLSNLENAVPAPLAR